MSRSIVNYQPTASPQTFPALSSQLNVHSRTGLSYYPSGFGTIGLRRRCDMSLAALRFLKRDVLTQRVNYTFRTKYYVNSF
jgi:hypothetical protein